MNGNEQARMSAQRLHAYVDGALSRSEAAEVEAFLAANPEQAAEVADWQRQNRALQALFPVSEAEARTAGMLAARAQKTGGWVKAAAALALVALGAGGGWFAHGAIGTAGGPKMAETLVEEAMLAHAVYSPEVLHPVEVGAANEAHLVGWLSKRLGARISAPDLSASGYALVGGRLLPADSGPAAQFMYENPAGDRITVYATTGSKGTLASFQFDSRHGLSGVYWQDERLRYAVVGKLDRAQLGKIAVEVYRQLI